MKLYAVQIFKTFHGDTTANPVLCCEVCDVSSFGFFARSSARQAIKFVGREVSKRVAPGTRMSVTANETTMAHCHSRTDGITAVVVSDPEYPVRVAFGLLRDVLEEFNTHFGGQLERIGPGHADSTCMWDGLQQSFTRYQNPQEVDKILQIRAQLDEVKSIMNESIERLLERGETIDKLVDKSSDLHEASKTFYRATPKSTCCPSS